MTPGESSFEAKVDPCFTGGGECGALMRSIRWAETPLGPSRQWPSTLRTLVPVMLATRFAMRILWGPDLILLYNDDYRSVLGPRKHPTAMGQPIERSYGELWPTVGPMFERAFHGETVVLDDGILPLNRSGYLEECYFTLSYSPIADEEGVIRGVLGVVHETTERVLAERRLVTLRTLAANLVDATTVEGVCRSAGDALTTNGADVPFVLFYLLDETQREGRLVASSGLPARLDVACPTVPLDADSTSWPLRVVAQGREPLAVTDLAGRFGEIHAGPFPETIGTAFILPLVRAGSTRPRLLIVAGVNPRHALDEMYRSFFELLAEHVAKAAFNVLAREEERRHAEALADAARAAEQAAEAERKRLYALFMQAPMPVAIIRGPEHVMELANAAALATWGKTRAIIGKTFLEGFPEMEGQGFDDLLRGVLESGVAYRGSEILTHLARGGPGLDAVYWNFVYAPLIEEESRVTGVLVCGFEVTDQVLARRRVERLAEELAQQKAALEGAHRAKDEFVATMSHELRTPLNAILGWTRMLKMDRVAPPRVPHALETIERNAVAQTALIDDLLDVSRILTGKVRLNVGSVDLPHVVEATLETLRPACEARSLQIHAVIDSHAGPVMGDPDRLSQIVTNLLSNAVKFTPKGGRIHVHLERAKSMVRLTVKDNGVGIAPEFLPFVFERFRQADQTITRRHGGLGLGLSIVKHLVELHGGTIVAQSDGLGLGATFTVTIPLSAVQVAADRTSPESVDLAPSRELEGLRVLVVDDEADARDLISEILTHGGVAVRTAGDAEAAMRELESFAPHILVCDVGMPGEDGYSLMQRIRALPPDRGGRVRAVAVTAYTRGEDRRRALAAGFNLHLSKPVDPSELTVSVARLAERYTPTPP
jgi:signal transduction histidine kinase/ActR/RegA family two-component response regulator